MECGSGCLYVCIVYTFSIYVHNVGVRYWKPTVICKKSFYNTTKTSFIISDQCKYNTPLARGWGVGGFQAKIEEIELSNVTPADYTVLVRGLPPDVTKDEASILPGLMSTVRVTTKGHEGGGRCKGSSLCGGGGYAGE